MEIVPKSEIEKDKPIVTNDWKAETLKIVRSKMAIKVFSVLAALVAARLLFNWIAHRRVKLTVPTVEVVSPTPRTIDAGFELPGNVEAVQEASLYAHISGYLKKLYVDEGDKVKKGQLLAEIDAPDIVQEYRKAKAEYDLKEVTRKRYSELLSQQVVSQQEFDTVDAEASESRARFENASSNVSYTRITAPFAGAIARRYKYPGDLISASGKSGSETPIFLIVNEEQLRVAINVPQIETARIKVGDTTSIHIDAIPDSAFPGKVSRIDAVMAESTKTERVLIDIANTTHLIHAGMFASVTLHLAHKDNALSVPKSAVHERTGGEHYVLAVKDKKLQAVTVALGVSDEKFVEIASGAAAADKVVVAGAGAITEGQDVNTRDAIPGGR